MKNVLILSVLGLFVFACAAGGEEEITNDEETAETQQPVRYSGYCQLDSTGKTTGKCVVGRGFCTAKTDSECPVGLSALDKVVYPGMMCGTVLFDMNRHCTAWAY